MDEEDYVPKETDHPGRRLKIARRGLYTQESLAAKLGVTRNTVQVWESTGRLPASETLLQAAITLKTSTDFLYALTLDPLPSWEPTSGMGARLREGAAPRTAESDGVVG